MRSDHVFPLKTGYMGRYILDGTNPVYEPDLVKWAEWFNYTNRRVAFTDVSDCISVSTVFLGLDHNFAEGRPILFETMIFGGPRDGEINRYHTWEEAISGHARMLKIAKNDGVES